MISRGHLANHNLNSLVLYFQIEPNQATMNRGYFQGYFKTENPAKRVHTWLPSNSSIPPGPLPHIPTLRGWYFFDYRFGFMRVCGECCGLWRRGFGAVKERVLSLGADSLIRVGMWIRVEVREWFLINL